MRRFFLMTRWAAVAGLAAASTTSRPARRPFRTRRPRRVAEVVPSHSARALLHQAIKDARRPDWSVLASAHRLVRRARGDARTLRLARGRLRQHSPRDLSPWQARALASLIVAVAEAEAEEPGPRTTVRHAS